jgi:hypothetical protein
MLRFDPDAVRQNVRESTDEDLLNRVTAYRVGMEPAAIDIIEAELKNRGIGRTEIERHEIEQHAHVLRRPEGFAYRCNFCHRPAVVRTWGWHWVWGLLPVVPIVQSFCAEHAPSSRETST